MKDKKCSVKDAMSIKITFKHYLKKTKAMLTVAFEEFGVAYMFKLLFSFHYNHHGAEISVIWLVERSAIKLLILHVTREK